MFCLPRTFVASGIGVVCYGIAVCSSHAQSIGEDKAADSQWRKKLGTFRVGIIGGNRPILETRRAQPFRLALQKALGVPVEVFAVRDYQALIKSHINSRIEYAVYSATAFSAAWSLCKCIEPLVSPKTIDGAIGFRSALFAQTKINSLRLLKGKTVLIPGRHSFTGYILPRYQMSEQGISIEDYGWKLDDKDTVENAIRTLKTDSASAIFGWVPDYGSFDAPKLDGRGTLALLEKRLGKSTKDYKTVWKSSPVPHGPHAIRKNLDEALKKLLKEFLVKLNETDKEA
ncbi:MAG: PhnD/SsuA/transferrin family substrate-binding protein, partial [Rhizobiaceae bacterium]